MDLIANVCLICAVNKDYSGRWIDPLCSHNHIFTLLWPKPLHSRNLDLKRWWISIPWLLIYGMHTVSSLINFNSSSPSPSPLQTSSSTPPSSPSLPHYPLYEKQLDLQIGLLGAGIVAMFQLIGLNKLIGILPLAYGDLWCWWRWRWWCWWLY